MKRLVVKLPILATITAVLFTFGAVEAQQCYDEATDSYCLVDHDAIIGPSLHLAVQIDPTIDRAAEFRIANDSWKGDDKKDHLIAGIGTMAISSVLWKADSDSDVWDMAGKNILLWTVWELKDAVWRWEDHGWWGGDGFSSKDLVWSAGGVVSMALVVIWLR